MVTLKFTVQLLNLCITFDCLEKTKGLKSHVTQFTEGSRVAICQEKNSQTLNDGEGGK